MADIKQIEVQGTNYNIAGAAIILEDNGTTTAGTWLARTDQISSLVIGQMFLYKPTKGASSTGTATLNINNLGAKQVQPIEDESGNNKITTEIISGQKPYLLLIYNENKFQILNGVPNQLFNITKITYGYADYTSPSIQLTGSSIDMKTSDYSTTEFLIGSGSFHFGFGNSSGGFDITSNGNNSSDGKFLKLYNEDSDDYLEIHTTKIFSSNYLILDGIHSRVHIGDNTYDACTKIYVSSSNNNNCDFYTRFLSHGNSGAEGMYINRPIHFVDENESSVYSSVSIRYNSTDDSLDFTFD